MALTQWAQGRIPEVVTKGEVVPGRDRNNVVLLWVRCGVGCDAPVLE
jgi:hypothetical protein